MATTDQLLKKVVSLEMKGLSLLITSATIIFSLGKITRFLRNRPRELEACL